MPLFKREAKIKVVTTEKQQTNEQAKNPIPVPPPPEPKSQEDEKLQNLKQRWLKALNDYSYGRFSGKTVVLNGKLYYKHVVLETTQGPNYKQEVFIGLNSEMAPCLVTAKIVYGLPASGVFKIDVEETPLSLDRAKSVGLTPEEALRILEAMEKSELSW
jgi:hypothetical protein